LKGTVTYTPQYGSLFSKGRITFGNVSSHGE